MFNRLLLALPLLTALPAWAQMPAASPLQPRVDSLRPAETGFYALPADPTVVRPAAEPLVPVQEQLRQVAGVQATPYSGAPGSPVVLRLRGATGVGLISNHPLYVVDGIALFQRPLPDPLAAGQSGLLLPEVTNNPLLSIPAQDIESVEVLKGALATTQYGLYGHNGVVLIRTRQGAERQPLRVGYTGYGSVQQVRRRYELLDAQQYARLANEVAANNGQPASYSPGQIAGYGAGTDWQDEVLRVAAGQQHHLSVDGGNAHGTRYYAAADYLGQQGVVRESRLRRYALRLNASQELFGHLRVEGRLGLSQTDERRPFTDLLRNALLAEPVTPARAPDGQYPRLLNNAFNPAQQVAENYRAPRQRRLQGQLGLYYQVLPGLSVELRGSLERDSLQLKQYASINFISSPGGPEVGGLNVEQDAGFRQWVLAPAVRLRRTLGQRHALTAAVEAQQWKNTFYTDVRTYAGGLGGSHSTSMFKTQSRNAVLTAGYAYDGRYELQAALRGDLPASFNPDTRWQWLPAGQLTWHAAQEGWLRASRVSQLDFWAGWGRTGTSQASSTPNRTGPLLIFPLLARTTQAEAGLRLGLWHDALGLALTAYQRRTEGTDFRPSGQVAGFGGLPYDVRNRGVEVTMTGHWRAGQLTGSSRLAAAVNQNAFTAGPQEYFLYSPARAAAGQPISTFFGYRSAGVDPSTGLFRYADPDGSGTVNFEDLQALGPAIPPRLLSFVQTLQRGRFGLQAQLDGMFGYQQFNSTLMTLDAPTGRTNSSTRALDRWTPAQRATDVPRAGSGPGRFSDYDLQSASHLRLTSAQLSCEAWRRGGRSAQVWLAGYNLLVISKYRGFDPNVSNAGADAQQAGSDASSYPSARTVALGVTATL